VKCIYRSLFTVALFQQYISSLGTMHGLHTVVDGA
jgi:hypothetical protein